MSETQTVYHVHQSAANEAVKIERNSRGYTWEVKAPTLERALELADTLTAELKKREEA